MWNINKQNMVWTGVSRALLTPSRSDTSIRVNLAAAPGPNNLPLLVGVFGNPDQLNESLNAVEAGYRNQLSSRVSLDLTAFFNDYDKLFSLEPGAAFLKTNPAPLHLVVPNYFGNGLMGETHGVEASANWRLTGHWTLSPGAILFWPCICTVTRQARTLRRLPKRRVRLRTIRRNCDLTLIYPGACNGTHRRTSSAASKRSLCRRTPASMPVSRGSRSNDSHQAGRAKSPERPSRRIETSRHPDDASNHDQAQLLCPINGAILKQE